MDNVNYKVTEPRLIHKMGLWEDYLVLIKVARPVHCRWWPSLVDSMRKGTEQQWHLSLPPDYRHDVPSCLMLLMTWLPQHDGLYFWTSNQDKPVLPYIAFVVVFYHSNWYVTKTEMSQSECEVFPTRSCVEHLFSSQWYYFGRLWNLQELGLLEEVGY